MESQIISDVRPSLFISNLRKYNSGQIAGQWVRLEAYNSAEELGAWIKDWLAQTNDQEWLITDYEALPGFGEYPDLDKIWKMYELIKQHGINEITAFIQCFSADDLDEDTFSERFQGEFQSVLDYCYQWIEDTGLLSGVPEHITRYFDYESFARDMQLGDITSSTIDGKVYVFLNL